MRLDQRLVELGLAESRARAKALIEAGAVSVDGAAARKASQAVSDGVEVIVTADPNPWVSRAALKLLHTLDEFGLTPRGVALGVGALTGGFTEVLLARGAERVLPWMSGMASCTLELPPIPGWSAWRASMRVRSPKECCHRSTGSPAMPRSSRWKRHCRVFWPWPNPAGFWWR